jgi:hypothetical protein
MFMNLLTVLAGMFWFSALMAAPPQEVTLEPRTALPNQHPFYNIVVFEQIDEKRGLIVRHQEWTEQIRVAQDVLGNDRRWHRTWTIEHRLGKKELSHRPIPTPTKTNKQNAAGSTGATEGLPEKQGGTIETHAAPDLHWEAPARAHTKESIPEKFTDEVPTPEFSEPAIALKKTPRPKPLLMKSPKTLQTIEWTSGNESSGDTSSTDGASADATDLLPILETLKPAILDWQADMHGRFGLCPVDKAEARNQGTLETLYVPYQVVSGRIYLVKANLDLLLDGLKHSPRRNQAGNTLRLLRRLHALESQLTLLEKENHPQKYKRPVLDSIEQLSAIAENWGPAVSVEERTWALRWQTISENLQLLIEREPAMGGHLAKKSIEVLSTERGHWKALLREIGARPWNLKFEEQQRLAKHLYASTNRFSTLYEELSDKADLGSITAKEYLDILAVLGANEDLRVTVYTMLQLF